LYFLNLSSRAELSEVWTEIAKALGQLGIGFILNKINNLDLFTNGHYRRLNLAYPVLVQWISEVKAELIWKPFYYRQWHNLDFLNFAFSNRLLSNDLQENDSLYFGTILSYAGSKLK